VYFELFKEILESNKDDASHKRNRNKGKARAGLEEGGGDEDDIDGKPTGKGKEKKGNEKTAEGDAGFAEVEDSTSKLVSAILTGVNRALPFAKIGLEDVE
jgi:ribosome biogenesis protein MAK21